MSPDNLSVTFPPPPGCGGSDGVPLTAYDMKFTYDAGHDPKVQNSLATSMRVNGKPFQLCGGRFVHIPGFDTGTVRAVHHVGGKRSRLLPRHVLESELKAGGVRFGIGVGTPPERLWDAVPTFSKNTIRG